MNPRRMVDLVVVSMHEKGFPQADFYRDAGEMDADEFERLGMSPDDFFTLSRTASLDDALTKANERWPGAVVKFAEDEDGEEDE